MLERLTKNVPNFFFFHKKELVYSIIKERKIIVISFILEYLQSVVIRVNHNDCSITKKCCRLWILKLSIIATFTSKLCNKLSTQFTLPEIRDKMAVARAH